MGAYTSQNTLELMIGRPALLDLLTEDDSESLSDSAVQDRLANAIEAAKDAVNEALAPHYTVPVADGDRVVGVRELASWKAIRILHERRGARGDDDAMINGARGVDDDLEAIRRGEKRVNGLTITRGLAQVTGSVSPLTTKPYQTDGPGDPDVANSGKTDPLEKY